MASYGAVLQKLKGSGSSGLPPFVHVGPSGYLPGAGNLGTAFSPFQVADPSRQVQHPDYTLSANVSGQRFQDRRALLQSIDQARATWHDNAAVEEMDQNYRRAVDLLTSDRVRTAFDLGREREDGAREDAVHILSASAQCPFGHRARRLDVSRIIERDQSLERRVGHRAARDAFFAVGRVKGGHGGRRHGAFPEGIH